MLRPSLARGRLFTLFPTSLTYSRVFIMSNNSLERVLTVHQSSMGSTRLPLELQQQVFSYLDARSFWATRNVCKWWRFASVESVTLAKQLQKLPIVPSVDARRSSPRELQDLFLEAAYTLMLGVRVEREADEDGSFSAQKQMGLLPGPQISATRSGDCTVTINDRTIALFDTTGNTPRVLTQRRLNDLKETVGNGPWLKVTPTSYHELALSSDGRLLAIAQERTIQIYDLSAEPDSFTVNEYISSAAGHYICGLDFEQNDHTLRVRLSGKGAVLYLGTPPADSKSERKADIEHWKSKSGLRHVFLDSNLISLPASYNGESVDTSPRFSGLQLLQPFENGYLFGAQKHGGDMSSHYILGHVRCSALCTSTPCLPLSVEPESVVILSRLESFLSAWDYTLNGSSGDSGMGLWENMPSCHEHHPSYALSKDMRTFVLAERDKKRIRPVPLSQLFVYRLPGVSRLRKSLQEEEQKRTVWRSPAASFLDRLEGNGRNAVTDKSARPEQKHSVGRIPLCLSTIQGVVYELKLDEVDTGESPGNTIMLTASAAETSKRWMLSQM